MNGFNIVSNTSIADISIEWKIVDTGDFDGNGKADLLWRDSAGNVAMWLMDGPNVIGYIGVGNVADRVRQ